MNTKEGVKGLQLANITKEFEKEARELILDGFKERFGFIDCSLNPDLKNIIGTYSKPGCLFLVGLIENIVVCTGAFTLEAEDTGRIVRMSVNREYRRLGIARKMINELESQAKHLGYKKLVLETNHEWTSAVQFYKKNGYSEERKELSCIHFLKLL
ncbi:GNAT family N-acetyltransferase [Neobacillus sp. PS3-34]|uniref:GNAT family N-acetyltransferase n=1 Tax=Neobacillus sp. PS3-34 TaxID=3070678 RepID=UPI0027DEBE2B|nr:GNAT family N-acetyltransferase [Neobacillus sp. PS3-34]WML47616.1 GNAT family N-acetyltransferase [Neobacillus sp. PS3-34]